MLNLMLHRLQPFHGAVNFILAQFYIGVNTLLKPVYTRAGGELTDPQEGCKLKDIKIKTSGEQPCLGVRQ